MQRVIKFSRVEIGYFDKGTKKGTMNAHSRNTQGQGWQIPIRDMTPNDLRKLADYMELHGVGSDEFGGERDLCR